MPTIDNTMQGGIGIQQGTSVLQVKSGAEIFVAGTINITSGGTFKVNSTAGATVSLLSTATTGSTALGASIINAASSDLNVTNGRVNDILSRLIALGILTSS